MLRAALRRAVIAADPKGADERRKETERRAKVSLYPDEESTATLAGQRLPGVHAAAAMARIKAMARALKASGAGGPIDLLCAQVYLGLLLGTLPLIPPAEGAPPGPPDDDGPGNGQSSSPPADDGPGNGQPSGPPAGDGPGGAVPPPSGPAADDGPGNGQPSGPGRDDVPPPSGPQDDAVPPPGMPMHPATTTSRARMTAWPGATGTAPARTTMMTPGRPRTGWTCQRLSRPPSSGRGTGRPLAECSTCPCPGRPLPESLPSPATSAGSGRSPPFMPDGSPNSRPATRLPNGGSS
jgi:hypothetical protein